MKIGVENLTTDFTNSWPTLFLIGASSYNWYSNSYSLAAIGQIWGNHGEIFGAKILSDSTMKQFLMLEPEKLLHNKKIDVISRKAEIFSKGGLGSFFEHGTKYSDDVLFSFNSEKMNFSEFLKDKSKRGECFDISGYNSDRRKKISYCGWSGN